MVWWVRCSHGREYGHWRCWQRKLYSARRRCSTAGRSSRGFRMARDYRRWIGREWSLYVDRAVIRATASIVSWSNILFSLSEMLFVVLLIFTTNSLSLAFTSLPITVYDDIDISPAIVQWSSVRHIFDNSFIHLFVPGSKSHKHEHKGQRDSHIDRQRQTDRQT